ncbi:serine/threonine protein kinase [Ktedonosporobacter rubrisoli]|uniref:non-specific serine/threonine protein kinase n=1 Tax=Ktedonosporobacter rubrisoli TaxID=2509675 RepID=A0A4P6JPZ7_KTERU|nr:protein kinase [Ktedonosporobacter rubrisoli]QBD77477.1 serine/threonine protein kinase [Ktedonosporobacter rubrisoli]
MKNELLAAVNRSMLSSEADPIPHIIGEMCSCKEMLELGWRVEEEFGQIWIGVAHQQAVRRLQGWKLHVSAAIPCAESVLRQALAVLLAEPTRFKVASSLSRLADLNQGRAGLSQIGKFITIYPSDDEQCIRLAVRLDEVTRGLRGPAIPSDLALRPGSLIYYRYGSFSEQLIADREGRPRAVIATSPGELIEDRRALTYHEPVGVKNPFLTAGFAGASTSHPILLQDRFLPIAPLHQSAQSIIYEAVDLQLARRCVLKRARRDALLDRYHRDAHDILRHEAHILSRLETVLSVPKTYALFKQDDDLWLAMDYIEGTLLKDYIKNQSHKAEHLPLGLLISWARELAFMLDKLHQAGIIYRDLKSANIIVTPDSFLRLIDFGISYDLASSDPQFYGGTRGYSSPQQNTNEPASIADDIYSFGALLYLLATGVEPAEAPHEVALLKRPLTVLNPNLPDTLCQIISRCLAPRPQDRFTCMQKIVAELQMVQDSSPISIIHTLDKVPANELDSYYSYACELGETLQVVVQTARRGKGLFGHS